MPENYGAKRPRLVAISVVNTSDSDVNDSRLCLLTSSRNVVDDPKASGRKFSLPFRQVWKMFLRCQWRSDNLGKVDDVISFTRSFVAAKSISRDVLEALFAGGHLKRPTYGKPRMAKSIQGMRFSHTLKPS